ncbi:MAG: hypothetical protein H0W83_16160 [Planctomycetes bacterium]|nr:hypothetical protein [Planctomycetota bacterium]
MTSRLALILGVLSLIAAQLLASKAIAPLRRDVMPTSEAYSALTPGEFAGTLMLGGFRGLACDLLWLRADAAQEQGRYYESLALFQTISRVQPRFEQVWTYMSWNMAYNLVHEVEDPDAKWSWFLAGIHSNVRGCERNPASLRLLVHLASMFQQRGDRFHHRIAAQEWAPLVNPVVERVNARVGPDRRLTPLPSGAGISNYRIASLLYRASGRLAEAIGAQQPPMARRMVPLTIECDGNQQRNGGHHREAVRTWIESMIVWQEVKAQYDAMPFVVDGYSERIDGIDSYERNEGRLRRKAAQLAALLHDDPQLANALAAAILARRFDEALALLSRPGWHDTASRGHVRWLDEN